MIIMYGKVSKVPYGRFVDLYVSRIGTAAGGDAAAAAEGFECIRYGRKATQLMFAV